LVWMTSANHKHKKARKAFTLRALRTSMMVLVTINQEFGGLAESELVC